MKDTGFANDKEVPQMIKEENLRNNKRGEECLKLLRRPRKKLRLKIIKEVNWLQENKQGARSQITHNTTR